MKMADVIQALQIRMPLVTDLFNETFTISSIVVGATQMEVFTTEDHLMADGDYLVIGGVKNGISIDSVSVADEIATLTFTTDHGYNFDSGYTQYVTITGSDDSDGEYELLAVIDEFNIQIAFDGTAITGAAMIEWDEGFNGTYSVDSVTGTNSFLITIRDDIFIKPQNAIDGGTLSVRIRISGAADMDRFNAAYTAQDNDNCWLVVTPASNRSSRDRDVPTDAITGVTQSGLGIGQTEIRQAQLETLTIYSVIPASQEISGRLAADIAEDVRWYLYKALVAADIPTEAEDAEIYALMPVSDNYFAYLADNTTYTHEYTFERVVYMSQLDVADPIDQTAPFRGLNLQVLPCDKQSG